MPLPLVPLAGAAIGGLLSFFQNKGKQDAEKEARKLYNDYLQGHTEAFNKLVSLAESHGYDMFGPQVTTTSGTSSGTTSSRSTTKSDQRAGKDIAAEYGPMEAQFRRLIEGRLGAATTVSEGEKARYLAGLNKTTRGATQSVANKAARYGMSGAQVAGGMTPIEIARSGQAADYLGAQVPAEERRRRNEDLALAQGAIGAFGVEDWNKGTSTTTGSSSSMGTTAGTTTAPPDFTSLFSMMKPVAPQAGSQTGYSPGLTAGQDLLSSLMALYANRKNPSTPNWNPSMGTP